ncbi:MAG: membrane protein insertion efficiency factor YidD [Candidatus Omnitrophica bacterium]|nr:membrane protein insertion efficiency factor YidD [Candidatus Omnitrophota bacterium]MBU1128715.1 membrane protein insertion efficiency factor YidD [Candidatus Omnitrophota bacterium]MBU1784830.1 membrane protein insertion efficiency factor YidD [Candidatus Omnitrophota bacterium]MBU1850994.1 membrane protein insertion efficiency factor YidD [Candidatus Omnitrophota bacterium]
MKQIIRKAIKAYQKLISPYIGRSCRYEPTCSQYAADAIEKLGIIKGTAKALWRILRCNPFSRGGYDPVEHYEKVKNKGY